MLTVFKIERPCSKLNTSAPTIVPQKSGISRFPAVKCAPQPEPGREAFVARAKKKKHPFSVKSFLNSVDGGRTITSYRTNEKIFSQGDPADAVFYIQEGKVKVCVTSEAGKEAVVALHGKGDFFGEGCLNGQPLRLATVTAITECVIMRLAQSGCRARAPRPTEVFQVFHVLSVGSERARRGRLGRSAFQFERKASGAGASLDGQLWQGGETRAGHSENQSRDARRDDRHHALAREHLHEQISGLGVHQIQR